MPTVDTLKLKTRLSESGMPESQAQVLVEELDEALSTAIARETATKADMVELRAAIRGLDERLTEFKSDTAKQFDELKADTAKQFDELKADTAEEFGELRTGTARRFDELKADTAKEFGEIRVDNGNMRTEIGSVKTEIGSMKSEIGEVKGELKLLRWMIGVTLTIVVGIGIRLLFM